MELYNQKGAVKINFYHWDRKLNQKKEFIGTAELKEGKLIFDVKDKRLENMLKRDIHTMITAKENGKLVEKLLNYKVGSIEHLQNVITHCKDISCIGEIEESSL